MNINNTNTRNISIDTLFRDNYDNTLSTDFSFNLQEPIEKVISMRISAMEIPNVWPSFSDKNNTNTFKISLYNFIDPSNNAFVTEREFLIQVPNGNYTSMNFIYMINAFFLNNGNGLQYLICTIDEIYTKTIFRAYNVLNDGNNVGNGLDPYYNIGENQYYSPTFYFTLDFSNGDNNNTIPKYKKCGWMLGFKKDYYTVRYTDVDIGIANVNQNNLLITFNGYIESESSYGSSVYPYIYLDINEFQSNTRAESLYHFVGNQPFKDNNILARISISSSQNTVLIDNGSDRIFKQRNYIGPITLEKLHIKLIDRFGRTIDLINNDYSFILEITYLQY